MTIWNEIETIPGKYPDKAFAAKLESAYIAQTKEKGNPYLRLNFTTGEQVSVFGFDQIEHDAQKHKTRTEEFKGLGQFIESLKKLHVTCFEARDDQETIEGFKTEPDLTGCTLYMRPVESKNKKQDGTPWTSWVIDKIEYPTKPDGSQKTEQARQAPTSTSASAPKSDLSDRQKSLDDAVMEVSEKTKNYREIWLALEKKYKISEITESVERLKAYGYIDQTWGK